MKPMSGFKPMAHGLEEWPRAPQACLTYRHGEQGSGIRTIDVPGVVPDKQPGRCREA